MQVRQTDPKEGTSLVLIKPDAMQRRLAGQIISRLEAQGLRIVAAKMLQMDKALAQHHYAIHESKPFFHDLVAFITASPIIALVFQGKNAVEVIRQTMGETDPAKAKSGTIRADLALDIQHNLVHGSDSIETALQEIQLFFSKDEIFDCGRDAEKRIC